MRFDALFEQLVLPLRASRSVRVTADTVTETATVYQRTTFEFLDVDVILLEGVFLFKSSLRPLYDRRVWVDCTEETALERAVARAQEGLPPAQTRAAYQRVYFPAQRLHEQLDRPRDTAHVVVRNDERLPPARE